MKNGMAELNDLFKQAGYLKRYPAFKEEELCWYIKMKKQEHCMPDAMLQLGIVNDIKAIDNSSIDISVNKFVEMYFEDKKGELKEHSLKNKRHMIEKHILPYYGEKKINEIKTTDIIKWQNLIREKDYTDTYQRML